MLPWYQKKLFLGRSDDTEKLYNVVEAEFTEIEAARCKWSVVYAAGRSGAGKTEIGKQAPREICRRCQEGSEMKKVLGNAAYLFIDMNGGGDKYSKKYDYELEPAHRMGWRLLAAVCRGSLGTVGVEELREEISGGKGPDIVEALRGKKFNEIAVLLESKVCDPRFPDKLARPLTAEEVLLALSRDLRDSTGAAVGELNSNERVAIYVHVDEHQLMYGEGLGEGASEKEKLTAHKDFLYDLCTLRGDGTNTWCNDNSIFLVPLFTGTASAVLKALTHETRFSKKLFLQLLPLKGEDSQKVFLNEVHTVNSNRGEQLSVHESWTTALNGKPPPLHFVLQELDCIPRLIKDKLPYDTATMNILSLSHNHTLLQDAFNSVGTARWPQNTAAPFGKEMTRVVVSGAHLDNLDVVLDGKTVADYEFEGIIRVTGEGCGSVCLPVIDYRKSVANIEGLSNIAAFANLQFDFKNWSDLWEMMCLDRFQNTLIVHGSLLKQGSIISLEKLYPGCIIPADSDRIVCPMHEDTNRKDDGNWRVCNDEFIFDHPAWTAMFEGIRNGECRSFKLEENHPAFDLIHLIRDKTELWCFLEQNKGPVSPTYESSNSPNNVACIRSCKNFIDHEIIQQMADAVKDQQIRLRVVPVYIDRRQKDIRYLQFWSKLWAEEKLKDLIKTTVTGGAESIPHLFPCLAHRFVLLEEEKKKEG